MKSQLITHACYLMLSLGLAAAPAHAGIVSASYTGIINEDSGLGLIGEIMRVDFSYDDQTPGFGSDPLVSSNTFENYLTAMTVSIAGNSWQWDRVNGYSSISLTNDLIDSLSGITVDSLQAFNSSFIGPDLVAGAFFYNFGLYLYDDTPSASPDGLDDQFALPSIAPNPDLFNTSLANRKAMTFSFNTGDLATGDYYFISTANVANAVVPIPSAIWLFGSTLVGLGFTRFSRRH